MKDKDSFSGEVKEELAGVPVKGRSQAYWEALALRRFLPTKPRRAAEGLLSAEPFLIRRFYQLLKQASDLRLVLGPDVAREPRGKRRVISPSDRALAAFPVGRLKESALCRRAFLRGAFLARGYVSSPTRSYHLEIALRSSKDALLVRLLLHKEGLEAGLVRRRSSYVVYIKDGDQIAEFLKAVGAFASVLRYEDIRARKSLKGSVQRLVNMDRANVQRSVEASLRQLEDIQLIDSELGLQHLPPALREIALLRLDNPDMCMEDLGQSLSPPASKSAVNHRFRRISAIADEIRAVRKRLRDK